MRGFGRGADQRGEAKARTLKAAGDLARDAFADPRRDDRRRGGEIAGGQAQEGRIADIANLGFGEPGGERLPVADEAALAAAAYYADREPIDGTITHADLTPLSCRWPTGNPRDLKTFRYCGETASWGPYCERHARLAYLPRAA